MDTGFQHEQSLSSALYRNAVSFQSNAIDSTSEMIMMGDHYRIPIMRNSDIVNSTSRFTQVGNSCGSLLVDSVPGLKHDAGLAVEWSVEEQYKLEQGLSKYADEPSIMRYIKIAATLRDKTVRDVALRCRWMARKRRKQDELNLGKKLKDKKDKLVESSSKPSISSLSALNVAPFSVTMNNQVQSDDLAFEALRSSIRHMLEQNNEVLGRISANITALKLQDNVELFSGMKHNIIAILNNMRYMPGPPLPVSLNEDLANTILRTTTQAMMFGSSSGMHIKQEPGY